MQAAIRDTLNIESITKLLKNIFESHDYIEKVYLFGSYARGEATPESDVDLYVVRNQETLLNFYSLFDEIENALNKGVDIIHDGETISEPLMRNIIRDRVLIYER